MKQGPAHVPGKPGRRERRRAEIRDRLYEAARDLFISRGIQATTVKDITDAADLGKGTFFNYFPTKEHILAMFYERQLGRAEDALRAAQERREPVRKTLKDLVQRTSEEPGQSPAMVLSFLLAIVANPTVSDIVVPVLQLRRQRVEELFAIGQRDGEIRCDWSASELARVQQELSFGTALFWALRPVVPLDKLLDANLDLFWSASTSRRATVGRKRSNVRRR